jgi:hypothetical protein
MRSWAISLKMGPPRRAGRSCRGKHNRPRDVRRRKERRGLFGAPWGDRIERGGGPGNRIFAVPDSQTGLLWDMPGISLFLRSERRDGSSVAELGVPMRVFMFFGCSRRDAAWAGHDVRRASSTVTAAAPTAVLRRFQDRPGANRRCFARRTSRALPLGHRRRGWQADSSRGAGRFVMSAQRCRTSAQKCGPAAAKMGAPHLCGPQPRLEWPTRTAIITSGLQIGGAAAGAFHARSLS